MAEPRRHGGTEASVHVSRGDAGVAVITIDDSMRAVDDALLGAIERACAAVHDDDGARVALLRGPFALAADVAPRAGRLPFRGIETMAQPVIAVIEGPAMGAGLELALACDIRLAAEDATFAFGGDATVPSLGGTQRLPRIAGRATAARMLLLGETLDARDALACGLINVVVPPGEAQSAARQLGETIASRGPLAVPYAKEAAVRGLDLPLEQALRYETDLTIILQTTADRAEGVRAFLEKRPPRFEGK
jgi:enoyl-CoA hydratase/carnithine racemase